MRNLSRTALFVSAVFVSALTLSGCTTASETENSASGQGGQAKVPTEIIAAAPYNEAAARLVPEAVRARGSLKIGTDPTYAPYELYAADNKTVIGWDADFAAALGQTLGLDIEIIPSTFDTILPGLDSHKFDIGLSAFSVTAERLKNADFVTYLIGGSGVAVAPGNPKNLSMDPLSQCGLKISGQKGSTQGIEILPLFSEKCVAAGKAAIDIQLFPSMSEANMALISGRVDAVMADSIGLSYQGKLANGTFELAPGEDYDPTKSGIALPKDSELTPAMAAAVKALIEQPAYREINAKWGVPDAAIVTVDQVDSK